jgi:hypothetical protein
VRLRIDAIGHISRSGSASFIADSIMMPFSS